MKNPQLKNSLDCVKFIYKNNGISGSHKGFLPCMVRSILVHVGIFSLHKYVLDKMSISLDKIKNISSLAILFNFFISFFNSHVRFFYLF